MPITFRVDRGRKLVLAAAQGVLTRETLVAYIGLVLRDPDVRPGFNELFDLRNVTKLQLSTTDMESVCRFIQEFGQQVKETKSALVMSGRNAEVDSRLFKLLEACAPATVRRFRDMREARAWLGIEDDIECCGSCIYWTDDGPPMEEVGSRGTLARCIAPAILRGVHFVFDDVPIDGALVEDDEGWGILTGSKFGCIQWVPRGSAATVD